MPPKKASKAAAAAAAVTPTKSRDQAQLTLKKREVVAEANPPAKETSRNPYLGLKILATVLAFVLRFWRLDHPDQVVFDEVHFGKFASHYLQREYYFDLHPPLAKLMYAAVGWLAGYDGRFKFENIGDNYVVNEVPYIYYRSLPAALGSATVPLVFGILEHCNFSPISCFFGAMLVVFDTAQIAQTRLILLDATLIFFMVAALYCYVRFREQRHTPFKFKWWMWLASTGFFLSCVISSKYVGLFTYLMIGVAVIADLWSIADVRGKPESQRTSLRVLFKHFVARFQTLIAIPFLIYLFWFWVHFQILTYSGPGDSHMSPEFQATLNENPVVKEALDIRFFDTVTIQGMGSNVYLHSHPSHYPLQYEDGRISSQGQQVTGYSHEDPNNLWQILPPELIEDPDELEHLDIVGSQKIMLRHVATDTYLLTHDVASPGFPTNEEFTTVNSELAYGERHADAQFYLDVISGGDKVRSKLTQFRLKHVSTSVVMWLSDRVLPDWGFQQREINGNKNLEASGSVWYFGAVPSVVSEEERAVRRTVAQGNVAERRPFWTDYYELQMQMFITNNQLTATHPYMSSPSDWPLMLRGISFWSSKDGKTAQIYLVGNFLGWFLIVAAVISFTVLLACDQFSIIRESEFLSKYARHKLNGSLLWLYLGYLFHYLPFFVMGRQLFLHHYLPAHVIGSMLVAGVLDLFCGQLDSPKLRGRSLTTTKVVVGVLLIGVIGLFVFFAPLVYGLPMSPESVRLRQWRKIQLQFNKES